MKPNTHISNPVALHPKTLLVQTLALIRTVAVLRNETFYHLNQRRNNRQFHCFMTGLSWYAQVDALLNTDKTSA